MSDRYDNMKACSPGNMKAQPPCPESRELWDIAYPPELSTRSSGGCHPWDSGSEPTSLVFFSVIGLLLPSPYWLPLGAFCEKFICTQILISGSTSGNLNLRFCSFPLLPPYSKPLPSLNCTTAPSTIYLFPRFFYHNSYHPRVTCVTLSHGHHS